MAAVLSRFGYAAPMYLVGPDGEIVNLAGLFQVIAANGQASDLDARDTNGGIVPVNKAHTFTYDDSGNLKTDTVSDGSGTWVRTFSYQNGQQLSDSGWVKQ